MFSRLVHHRKTHGAKNKCYKCDLCFTDSTELKSHPCIPSPTSKGLHQSEESGNTFKDSTKLDGHDSINKHCCQECGKMFRFRFALFKHSKIHRPYKCTHCRLSFAQQDKLAKHLKAHDGPHKCRHCGKNFSQRYRVIRHERTHVGKKSSEYCVNGKKLALSPYIVTQSSSKSDENPSCSEPTRIRTMKVRLNCGVCGMNFPNDSELEIHLKTHNDNLYQCEKCDKSYSKHGNLMKHYFLTHSTNTFKCTECGQEFSQNDDLRQHLKTHMAQPKPHRCNSCGECFMEYDMLVTHLVLHNNQLGFGSDNDSFPAQNSLMKDVNMPMVLIPYSSEDKPSPQCDGLNKEISTENKQHVCLKCNKSFVKRNLLNKHMRTHAKGMTKNKCKECYKGFSDPDELIEHICYSHTERRPPPYSCQLCNEGYPERHQLNRHLKTHLSKMPHQCDQCDKRFPEKYMLEVHHRSHTGDGPFQCKQCDRSFNLCSHLDSHVQFKHTQKTYKCHVCGLRYAMHSALIRHLQKHASKKINNYEKPIVQSIPDRSNLGNILPENTVAQRPYKCKYCNKDFNHPSIHSRHIRNVHKLEENILNVNPYSKHLAQNSSVGVDKASVSNGISVNHASKKINNYKKPIVQSIPDRSNLGNISPENAVVQRPYKCKYCNQDFNHQSNHSRHIRNVHKSKKNILNVNPYSKHLAQNNSVSVDKTSVSNGISVNTVGEQETHKCMICGQEFSLFQNLSCHLNTVHPPEMNCIRPDSNPTTAVQKSHKCLECGKIFPGRDHLRRHMNRHAAQKMLNFKVCGKSDQGTNIPVAEQGHFKCMQCGELFTDRSNLRRHVRMLHSGKDLKDDGTSDNTSLASLPSTSIIHKLYECMDCGKCFHYNSNLIRHMKTHSVSKILSKEHSPENDVGLDGSAIKLDKNKPYKCNQCDKTFSFSSNIRRHLKTHTLEALSLPIPPGEAAGVKADKGYCCKQCGKRFQDGWKLKRHLKAQMHCAELEHKCQVCADSFVSITELNKHLNEHNTTGAVTEKKSQQSMEECVSEVYPTSEANMEENGGRNANRPTYKCNKCDRTFLFQAQLRGHLSSHTLKKGHNSKHNSRCRVCRKSFDNIRHLKRHLLTKKHTEKLASTVQEPTKCKECSKVFQTIPQLNGHMRTHSANYQKLQQSAEENVKDNLPTSDDYVEDNHNANDSSYYCTKCDRTCPTQAQLKIHLSLHTPKNRIKMVFECQLCNKMFPSQSKLNRHMNTKRHNINMAHSSSPTSGNLRKKLFKCQLCGKSFPNGKKLNRHMNTKKHSVKLTHQCMVCMARFSDVANLNLHVTTHTVEKTQFEETISVENHFIAQKSLQCKECGKTFQTLAQLHRHVKTHSLIQQTLFSCKLCSKSFSHKYRLERHMKTNKHNMNLSHECVLCKKVFSDVTKLNIHLMTHNSEKSGLSEEIISVDSQCMLPVTTPVPLECKICCKRFVNKNKFEKHVSNHAKEKLHKCKLCEKCFPDIHKLNRHLQTQKHTVKWPYKCKVCGEAFPNNPKMYRHLRVMHRKKLECPLCGKGFVDNSKLQRHLRTQKHSAQRSYKCQFCTKTFPNDSRLKIHLKKVHNKGEVPLHTSRVVSSEEQSEQDGSDGVDSHTSTIGEQSEPAGKFFSSNTTEEHHDSSQLGTRKSEENPDSKDGVMVYSAKWPYCCRVCGKGFDLMSRMITHEKIHLNRELYKCTECGVDFCDNKKLQKHLITHINTHMNISGELVPSVELSVDIIKEEPLEMESM